MRRGRRPRQRFWTRSTSPTRGRRSDRDRRPAIRPARPEPIRPLATPPLPSPEGSSSMNLERFTQKAQEAIAGAQALAERLQSPVLDAEHILASLVETDDGIPAQTLRRLGVDLAAFRGKLAARRSRVARSRSTPAPAACSSAPARFLAGALEHAAGA